MGTRDFIDSDPENITPLELDVLFAKGRKVYATHIRPLLERVREHTDDPHVVDYGCGVGRLMKPAIEDTVKITGVDISPTMLGHAKILAPGANDYVLVERGKSGLRVRSANLVFSFATLKHIATLEEYWSAIDEMCRILKKDGVLAINLNTRDFTHGKLDKPLRTVNHEGRSEHFAVNASKPSKAYEYNSWVGIQISWHDLKDRLEANGLRIEDVYYHSLKKLTGIWVVARKL
jgi:SAM-dependent methyltransferase